MAVCSIRFGITDGKGHSAATWKLWTPNGENKSDIYLACRELGGALKASFHKSGCWRIAYIKETFEQKVEGTSAKHRNRVIDMWPRPKPIGEGITRAYCIVTPWSAVTSSIGNIKNNKIHWIPNAPKQKATEIDIIITALGISTTDWPGKRSMGTSLIGSLELENGERWWVVYRVIDMPNLLSPENAPIHFVITIIHKHDTNMLSGISCCAPFSIVNVQFPIDHDDLSGVAWRAKTEATGLISNC